MGTEQKATELLLDAFAKSASVHDWKLFLVGTIENGFNTYIQNYYENNPELKSRVVFTGAISSKKELQVYYDKAKVFVLPSKWESFGLVLLEALSAGCYLIGSDKIPAIPDLIENTNYGQIFEFGSSEKLTQALIKTAKQEYSDVHIAEEINYAEKNYRWDKIIDNLVMELIKLESIGKVK